MPFRGKDVHHSIVFSLELFLVLKAKKLSLGEGSGQWGNVIAHLFS